MHDETISRHSENVISSILLQNGFIRRRKPFCMMVLEPILDLLKRTLAILYMYHASTARREGFWLILKSCIKKRYYQRKNSSPSSTRDSVKI